MKPDLPGSKDFPGDAVVKNLSASAGDSRDVGLIPGSGRSSGEGNGNPLQYSSLENPLDRRTWCAIVHGITKRYNCALAHTHTHTHGSAWFQSPKLFSYIKRNDRKQLVYYRVKVNFCMSKENAHP